MPAIVPPGDEIAIGHEFPGSKQDHQYARHHAAYRGRYRLVADRPRCHQQSQTEETLSPFLQIGRNDKSLYGKQNDAQPEHDGHPGSRSGEAQGERRQDQPHAQQQAGDVLPMLNAHDAHLPSFSLYNNALMMMPSEKGRIVAGKQQAILRLFKVARVSTGNMPTLPAIFPDGIAPVGWTGAQWPDSRRR